MKNKKINRKIANNRWFIWTIVFLVVAGVGLVTWMMTSDDGMGDYGTVAHHPVKIVRGKIVK